MGMARVPICPNVTTTNRCGCELNEGCNKPDGDPTPPPVPTTSATAPTATVQLHCEDGRWWAECDQVRFWSAAGDSRREVEQLSREAMRINVDPDVTVVFLSPGAQNSAQNSPAPAEELRAIAEAVPCPDPTPPAVLPLDALMELAAPLLREAFDGMPPEQAAITALGRRIRAEVARIHAAGVAAGARLADDAIGWDLTCLNCAHRLNRLYEERATGYEEGVAAGRTGTATDHRTDVITRWRGREWAESEVSLLLHADDMNECEHDIHGNPHACYQDKTDALLEKLVEMGWTPPDVPYTVAELDAAARIAEPGADR